MGESSHVYFWKSSTEIRMHQNWCDPNCQSFLSVLGYFTFTLTLVAGGNMSQKLDVYINSSYKTQDCHKKTHRTSLVCCPLCDFLHQMVPNFHDLQEFCTWKKPVAASIVTTFLFARSVLKLGVNTGTSC